MGGAITAEEASAALEYGASVINAKLAGMSVYYHTMRMTHFQLPFQLLIQSMLLLHGFRQL
jgi:hypothetical protein